MVRQLVFVAFMTAVFCLGAILTFHPDRYLYTTLLVEEHRPMLNNKGPVVDKYARFFVDRWQSRRLRCQPPILTKEEKHIELYEIVDQVLQEKQDGNWKSLESHHESLCGSNARKAAANFANYYPSRSVLRPKQSRIIITSMLTHPLGLELAMTLAKLCKTEMILGIDALMPNTPQHRMLMMDRYAWLKREIPSLRKIWIALNGVEPIGASPGGLTEMMQGFAPTHVVHLPTYTSTSTTVSRQVTGDEDDEGSEEESNGALYAARDTQVSMEQLLQFLAQQVASSKTPQTHFVYAGQNIMLEQALAKSYHRFHRVSSVGIILPKVYSVWDERGSWVRTMVEGIVAPGNATALNETVYGHESFLYSSDAVDTIVAAMQFDRPEATAFHLSSDVTPAKLESAVLSIVSDNKADKKRLSKLDNNERSVPELGWEPETSPVEGMTQMLAWFYNKAHPYGDDKSNTRRQAFLSATVGAAARSKRKNLFHRTPFPCASECSNHRVEDGCISTPFDQAIKISQKKTAGCEQVMYLVNLWPDTKTLPPSGKRAAKKSTLCQIAFISSKSAVAKDEKSLNGWDPVIIKGDAIEMTEAEYMLLKLSPGRFFHKDVFRALYVDPHQFLLPSTAAVLKMSKVIDTPPRKGKEVRIERPGTTIFKLEYEPDSLGRNSILFSQEQPWKVNETEKPVPVQDRVDEIVKRDGIKVKKERVDSQVGLYSHAAHLVVNNERRTMAVRAYNGRRYAKFPYVWIRSSMLAHDFRYEEALSLRCEWYDEQLFWANSDLEDLSFAYVMARRRVLNEMGEPQEGWVPLLEKFEDGEETIHIDPKTNNELYIRFLEKKQDEGKIDSKKKTEEK